MLRLYYIFIFWALPLAGMACYPEQLTVLDKLAIVRTSQPVAMGANCAFVNAGLQDRTSGGPPVPVGNARFYQVIEQGVTLSNFPSAIVVDCEEKAMTLVIAEPTGTDHLLSSCGSFAKEFHEFLPPNGPLDFTEGHDLTAFEQIAIAAAEMTIDPNVRTLVGPDLWLGGITFPLKDRVDFLCGCKIHYPDSAGAQS